MKTSTGRATKADKARFEALRQIGCIACLKLNTWGFCGPTEIHHTLSGNRRRGHDFTMPLGSYHHRGVLPPGVGRKDMEAVYGPSLANGSKPFHARFGSDQELLAETNRLIGVLK